jgi:hypothetical protein
MRDTPIARLRFWYAQTVLPLVYDYSLSLYELVCKLADSINQALDAWPAFQGQTVSNIIAKSAYIEGPYRLTIYWT